MSQAIEALIWIVKQAPAMAVCGDRVRTGNAGQVDERPYCLMWDVGGQNVGALDGETDMDTTTVQIDLFADTLAQANVLGAAVRDVVASFQRGNATNTWIASIIRTGGPRQSSERIGIGADDLIAKVSLDFRLHYKIR